MYIEKINKPNDIKKISKNHLIEDDQTKILHLQ